MQQGEPKPLPNFSTRCSTDVPAKQGVRCSNTLDMVCAVHLSHVLPCVCRRVCRNIVDTRVCRDFDGYGENGVMTRGLKYQIEDNQKLRVVS